MKKISLLVFVLLAGCQLTGCTTSNPVEWWNERTEGEKVVIGGVTGMVVTGLIIRNGQGDTQVQNQCISTRSLETGCP